VLQHGLQEFQNHGLELVPGEGSRWKIQQGEAWLCNCRRSGSTAREGDKEEESHSENENENERAECALASNEVLMQYPNSCRIGQDVGDTERYGKIRCTPGMLAGRPININNAPAEEPSLEKVQTEGEYPRVKRQTVEVDEINITRDLQGKSQLPSMRRGEIMME